MISVCLCLHCFAIFIKTMKQWLKRTQSPQTSRGQRSPSHSRQFRQVITRLTDGYTNGHFLAYCLVSKQSSYGIFLNERLLAIDTQARQLRYYSHIPQLPLKHPKDLPSPKQVIAIRAGVQFQIEKVRIGHVSIRWEQNRQPRHWKLIMGNNQIAKDFYELFGKVLSVETQQAKAREVPLGKQYKISTVQTASTPIKQDLFNFKQQIQIRSTPFSQFNFETMKTPQRKDNDLMNQSSAQKLNISLKDSHYFREEGEGFLSSRLKELQIQHSPIILKDDNSLQRTGLLAVQWLQAKNDLQRIAVYSKFVRICSRKVQLMMQNFIATHLMHEQSNKMCLIRDNDIQIYYVPLINSTEEEPFSTFFTNINQETTMIEEWQCLNYLSIFRQTQKMQILVPMTCIISYKSFKFYCKNSLQMYPHKQKLSSSQFQQQMGALQQLSHLPIRNGSQLIYLIQQGNEKLVYLDHVSCLPKITPLLSVSTTYIQLFLTRGVVSNQKDIQAISQHISNKLVRKTLQNLAQKSFTTCCQVMDFIKQSGLSQHYLSFFLNNKQQDYIYLQRLIASQMVACAAEWQIRRRMQTQLFKKRQFGFAINQVRTAVSLLLQEDKYFLGIINQILKAMFNITFPENSLSTFIQSQAMIISLFNRLGFDCRGAFLDADQMSNAWSENYINDYVELTPFINTILIRFDAFSQHHRTLNNCIRPINFEINTQITLEQVLNVLSLRKNASGLYLVSNNYIILPQALKMKVNYYLSHFIAPSFQPAPQQSLQALIYGDTFAVTSPNPHYYTHTIQHLTTLNKVRWLARMKYLPIVEQLLEKQVEQAIIWNQLALLVQIYGFTAKLKLRQGQISNGLQCSLKALQYALKQYEKEPTVLMQLVIAQQAFQAGNFHYNVHNFSKALELYCTVQDILSKISTSGENITLNPQFLDLYVNKCSIHLLFGDYAECFQQCLSSLKSCNKFNNEHMGKGQPLQQQFKIYEILFRCYQIKNMRKQMVQVTSICCLKFFEDSVFKSIQPNLAIFSSLLKMLWMSVIKQIQSLSTTRVSDLHQSAKLKTIYLKKVRKQLKQLRYALNHEHRYSREQAATFMARKVFKSIQPPQDCRLIMMTIDCLSEVSLKSRSLHSSKLYDKESLQNQWLTLQMMAVLTGYDFLMGAIDDYLRIYDFEP